MPLFTVLLGMSDKNMTLNPYFNILFSLNLVVVARRWSLGARARAWKSTFFPLQWRHNERDGVSNHQPHDCLLKRLFWRRSKKTSKLCVTGLCEGNSPVNSPHKGREMRKCFHSLTSSYRLWRVAVIQQPWSEPILMKICITIKDYLGVRC